MRTTEALVADINDYTKQAATAAGGHGGASGGFGRMD
jgi:hypothetical protein